ncbi:hypothetical protein GE21DRAFT_2558 [Neurospora crassa]|uniref:Uncharacterized protein n=1 Tax=Neurospora crassa (strain ATCC 24698 / 74-OR23-1A / CBS 708.71 / DSM 1257 / FGSC 987) TaxID=367110 RepID=Q7SF68_NEUCR|nr:hypothetical protein NCU09242 [Neurospora crassa OR74A]EAA35441.3 hypothetical protein NCU09242 [Neurospora crassa OR74A]KHE80870.1 hypothetical protein GE21DRAFT_2558 [Neurospora crassa]|eukprot:XP_964677.3 hypothetical protein NCU09242 [Neurospora crassa OR74A]
MGRKDRNPTWREANIWEKPTRRYSTWATTTTWRTNTWASNDVDPDPEVQKHTAEEAKTKKPSRWRWRSLACGMKHSPALACDMYKPAFPWITHLHCPFLCISACPPPLRSQEPAEKEAPWTPSTFRLPFDWTLGGNIRQHLWTGLDMGVTMNAGTSTAKRARNG